MRRQIGIQARTGQGRAHRRGNLIQRAGLDFHTRLERPKRKVDRREVIVHSCIISNQTPRDQGSQQGRSGWVRRPPVRFIRYRSISPCIAVADRSLKYCSTAFVRSVRSGAPSDRITRLMVIGSLRGGNGVLDFLFDFSMEHPFSPSVSLSIECAFRRHRHDLGRFLALLGRGADTVGSVPVIVRHQIEDSIFFFGSS